MGLIRIEAKLQRHCVQRHPATFPYMMFLHRWPFCIRHHFIFVFVFSVAVIVRFAIESFCSYSVVYFVIETVGFTKITVRSSILICSMNIIVCSAEMYFLPYPPPIDLTQSYDKNPYTNRIFENQWTAQNATKNLDYITISDRLRTVSWSNNSRPTGVVKPAYGNPTF